MQSYNNLNDDELAMAFMKREPGSAKALYEKWWKCLGRFLAQHFPYIQPHDREDLIQDTFVVVLNKISNFSGKKFAPWIIGICRHKVFHLIRWKSYRIGEDCVDLSALSAKWFQGGDPASYFDPPFEDSLDARQMTEALKCLSPRDRHMIELADGGGRDHEWIAQILNISKSAVASALVASRRKVREAYERIHEPAS